MNSRFRRLLPIVVVALGIVAGVLVAVVLATREAQPIGQSSPTPLTDGSVAAEPSVEPSTEPSASLSFDPTPTPVPSASAAPSGPARLAWTAGTSQDGVVNAVIRFGDRWIAGGWLGSPGPHAAVWTSTDGVSWSEPVLLEPELRVDVDCDQHWITGFAPWNGGLLALGWNGFGCGDGGNPMLWQSGDGAGWDLVDITGTAFAAAAPFPHSAEEAPDGRLAVFGSTHLGSVQALFLTSDLESWEMHPITDSAEAGASIARVAASPTLLIGVGSIVIGERPVETWTEEIYGPHVLASTDGSTWTSIAPPIEEGAIADIAWDAAHDRFVAVGTDVDGLPFAWLTTDGSEWTPIPLGEEPTYIHRVAVGDGLIVATGETGSGFEVTSGDTIVWSSHDGLTWWYGTVVERREANVEAATSEEAILILDRSTDAETAWLSLAGRLTGAE